jgi:hypothetical protein
MHKETRRISARTPLLDHAGETLGWYDAVSVRELMSRPGVYVIGTRTRVTGLRFAGPDPAGLLLSGSRHRSSTGEPHRNENYYNPQGCWHIDFIPHHWRAFFSMAYAQDS